MEEPRDTLTLAEVAERLHLHYMTVYRYVRTGRLPATKVLGEWQIAEGDLAALTDSAATGPVPVGSRRGRYPMLLERRMQLGDEAGAWSVINDALAGGMEPAEVLLDIIGPAMASIGEGWQRGTVTVADEHRATATVGRLIARLGPRFATRGRSRGHVVLGAIPGDHHALPNAMLRDLLRGRNLEVTDLGADVPIESWSDAVGAAVHGSPRLVAIGVGASNPGGDDALAAVLAAVRALTPAPIVVGGAGSGNSESLITAQADHHSRSMREAVEIFDTLASRAAVRRPSGGSESASPSV